MHIKHIPRAIKRRVVREMYDDHPEYLGQTVTWTAREHYSVGEVSKCSMCAAKVYHFV